MIACRMATSHWLEDGPRKIKIRTLRAAPAGRRGVSDSSLLLLVFTGRSALREASAAWGTSKLSNRVPTSVGTRSSTAEGDRERQTTALASGSAPRIRTSKRY